MDNLIKIHSVKVTPEYPLFVFQVDNSLKEKELFISVNEGKLKEVVPMSGIYAEGRFVIGVEVTPKVTNEIVVWEKSEEVINKSQFNEE